MLLDQNNHPNVYVHQGFLEAATIIYQELVHSRLLQLLTQEHTARPTSSSISWLKDHAPSLLELVDDQEHRAIVEKLAHKCQGFNVLLVGHSLGAGVAAVLATQLATHLPRSLHAYAYSCPGSHNPACVFMPW